MMEELEKKRIEIETETVEGYLKRFNAWFQKANAPIIEGYEKASAAVVLEDGGEWGCDWDMDALAINAAAREAIQHTDLLDGALAKQWLSALDSADVRHSVYSVGTLMHMGNYAVDCFGEKTSEFYLEQSKAPTTTPDGEIQALLYPETICGGQAVSGRIAARLRSEKGKLLLVDAEYVPD